MGQILFKNIRLLSEKHLPKYQLYLALYPVLPIMEQLQLVFFLCQMLHKLDLLPTLKWQMSPGIQ